MEFGFNGIAENMYAQVDEEGRQYLLLDEIFDHRSDGSAVATDDMYFTDKRGKKSLRQTTKGWQLNVKWKDGSSSWERLADLKESHPVQVAEYAVVNKLTEIPAFKWWIGNVLRRRDRIIGKVKSRYWKRTHKFGIRIPKTLAEALDIDKDTGTDLWRKAIEKEMANVKTAFQVLNEDEKVPIGYLQIPCHMIFDVKMDLTRKARFVAGGHMTDPPTVLTYSSVVSRESVRIAFLVAALNDLDVLAADVTNAYLNAPTDEKFYTIGGKEFGSDEGKHILIVRALYGLKSSGAAWHKHLAQTMNDLNFTPCRGDPDMWMRAATKPDGFKYYEYVLIYVDDILVISHLPSAIMNVLSLHYKLKEGRIG